MSQKQEILKHLEQGNSLNALESLRMYQCFRLASRIEELRKDGHNVITTMFKTPTGKHIANYKMGV